MRTDGSSATSEAATTVTNTTTTTTAADAKRTSTAPSPTGYAVARPRKSSSPASRGRTASPSPARESKPLSRSPAGRATQERPEAERRRPPQLVQEKRRPAKNGKGRESTWARRRAERRTCPTNDAENATGEATLVRTLRALGSPGPRGMEGPWTSGLFSRSTVHRQHTLVLAVEEVSNDWDDIGEAPPSIRPKLCLVVPCREPMLEHVGVVEALRRS